MRVMDKQWEQYVNVPLKGTIKDNNAFAKENLGTSIKRLPESM